MDEKKFQVLRSAIQEEGYDWEAGVTSVSERSDAEQEAMLGLIVDKAELDATAQAIEGATKLQAFQAPIAAPSAVDWRNRGGDWTTSVKDQGGCGSCIAFGTLATMESRINIACTKPNLDKDLSEAHLQFCGGGSCGGWTFAPALNYCKNTGVALDSSFPYTPQQQPCKSGVPIYWKITSWNQVITIADRKNILATKGPMVAGMAVYSDFSSYRSGVYRKTPNATLKGYHCISVVGYNDAERCWICKNSWGPNWGDSGWFKIGYGECLIDTSFAFYDMDVKCPSPPVDPCKKHIPLLIKILKAARRNPRLKACLRYYICRRGRRPRDCRRYNRIIRLVWLILRRCPRYRASFCRYLG